MTGARARRRGTVPAARAHPPSAPVRAGRTRARRARQTRTALAPPAGRRAVCGAGERASPAGRTPAARAGSAAPRSFCSPTARSTGRDRWCSGGGAATVARIVQVPPSSPSSSAAQPRARPEFSFPAVAAEGDVVAFLEPEPAQGNQDENRNGTVFDTILRVFRLGGGELTGESSPLTADA